MDISVGDVVMVGSRIGLPNQKATVVDIIPSNEYRHAMYRVRFNPTLPPDTPTLTPNPDEMWIDAPLVWKI